ncbi:menaquinone biosynthesis protein [Terriglobus aquaticus]|uniref:Chorismate dehydratase n=1 Tax=Terriglobus aquaticus TaxID=940139 RepID=A0ABW9KN75_9BACT|nr:menaquinone biosynthesis protein [Terriglobus aquaticus]
MPLQEPARLRVAAIDFLNPAPLLYHFEHSPAREQLAARYDVRYTSPALCAQQLSTGEADLGLVPIGAMPFLPGVAAVPGCTIASLRQVRSIQLVLRPGVTLGTIQTLAADAASRSSVAYVQVLLRSFHKAAPTVATETADLPAMLATHDAALLIGDPALLAVEARDRDGAFADCTWIDVASWWHDCTGLPWVAAVWAVRTEALRTAATSAAQLADDLLASRDAGLAHVDDLVREWGERIAVPPATIRTYLTANIRYDLNSACLDAIHRFYTLAASTGVLPAYTLPLLSR